MFNSKAKIIILTALICLLVALGGGAIYYYSSEGYQVKKRLAGDEQLLAVYDRIKGQEKKNKQEGKITLERVIIIGNSWKGLGDQTQDKFFYQKSLAVYQEGIKLFGEKNVLVYWNAGKVAEYLEDYNLAESYYRQSIAISPSYEDPYRNLADLYRFKMNKDPKDIIAVYDEGMEATAGNASLFLDKCSYLRLSANYAEALACYKILSKNYPDNSGYKEVIQELESKIK
ncbi:hypothetical protein COU01_01335 [Candidatus Falkowbacteria bacterium CG10_big_fil_rev_8_21_14_0_10_44_15]|uniref:Uncharacterized protein n=1 Tax=Candidatus Falkowbacteria bacterium CG10_big_fil_rev_8_21_14_0_10_44_15 TaxID=1974569 RepID=A0A2H0V210_9BACT|nr:MAG: hypothetical protein COU01_01335 [Candidatus Falkowbacteria bacterium CG10_big_fil_rev_8_21_14_0_10_44_15]